MGIGALTFPPAKTYSNLLMRCALLGAHGSWWAPRTSNPLSGTRVSEVGSIPTRSRHLGSGVFRRRAGQWALLVLLWAPLHLGVGVSHAAEPGDATAGETTPVEPGEATEETTTPEVREAPTAETAAIPAVTDTTAWHRTPVATMFKSVLVPGWGQWSNGKHLKSGAFFLVEGYFVYRAARAAGNEWDAEDLGDTDSAQMWNEERRNYTWWLLFTVVLSMGDAYVDAHLRGFDVEFEPEEQGGRAAIHWTF